MRIGIGTVVNELTESIVDIAPAVEERAFDSIWMGEHTHLPVHTSHRYTIGGKLPDIYKRFPDPFVTLAAAAAVTSQIRLCTSVCLVTEHNPLHLAKATATLDQLSKGRYEFGIGYGWNPLEMENNDVDPKRNKDVFREKVRAIKALWTQETAAFDGEFVSFTESWSWPKPVQQPHPPILIGAAPREYTFRDIAELGDGWIPDYTFVGEQLPEHVATLRRRVEEAGRDPDALDITVVGLTGFRRRTFEDFDARVPTPERLEQLAAIGVGRVVLSVPVGDRSFMLRALDRLAELRNAMASV